MLKAISQIEKKNANDKNPYFDYQQSKGFLGL